MASQEQVKQYLAYWFQLGKKVVIQNGKAVLSPTTVLQGAHYSPEFEACWQYFLSPSSGDCYLEGMSQTIQELLEPTWEIDPCARCNMPVPVASLGMPDLSCPCFDLPTWPNAELPQPRSPVDSTVKLNEIRDRLSRLP